MGVLNSHLHTRQKASLFDVSHMLQTSWKGKDAISFIEKLVVGDIRELKNGQSTLSLFTLPTGGILDDTVIQKINGSELYVVNNAGCAEKVWKHIQSELVDFQNKGGDVYVEILNASLVALQGPMAVSAIEKVSNVSIQDLSFMNGKSLTIQDFSVHISRCGYTGEDGN